MRHVYLSLLLCAAILAVQAAMPEQPGASYAGINTFLRNIIYLFDLECVAKALQAAGFENPVVKERVFEQNYLASYRRFFKSARIETDYLELNRLVSNTGRNHGLLSIDDGMFLLTTNPQPWFSSNLTTVLLSFGHDGFQDELSYFLSYFEENIAGYQSDSAKWISDRNNSLLAKSYLAKPAKSLSPAVLRNAWSTDSVSYELRIDKQLRVNGFKWSHALVLKLFLIEIHRTTKRNAEKVIEEVFPLSMLSAIRAPFPATEYPSHSIAVGDIVDNRAVATMSEVSTSYALTPSIPVFAPLNSVCIGASAKSVLAKGQPVSVFLSNVLETPVSIYRFSSITISIPPITELPLPAKKIDSFIQAIVWALPTPNFIDSIDCSVLPEPYPGVNSK